MRHGEGGLVPPFSVFGRQEESGVRSQESGGRSQESGGRRNNQP
ncbi:hypothetical protein V0288_04730 [Pannus brasiliensis CCIBt3594]|uniref:Uncharacterized protein n=1 Tax=Pannus brasiliensis CCIBt3594 TaxID=1427578 RepID=A0AAW9QSU9_9CHRO